MVEDEEGTAAETEGGYAREMSEAYRRKQAALVAETLKRQDIVICTALIPGHVAPTLIDDDMVKNMKPGSTTTSTPRAANLSTVSGDAATRD